MSLATIAPPADAPWAPSLRHLADYVTSQVGAAGSMIAAQAARHDTLEGRVAALEERANVLETVQATLTVNPLQE